MQNVTNHNSRNLNLKTQLFVSKIENYAKTILFACTVPRLKIWRTSSAVFHHKGKKHIEGGVCLIGFVRKTVDFLCYVCSEGIYY